MGFELKRLKWILIAAILSGAMFFFGSGLHPHWYLTWFAPVPVLLAAPKLSWRWALATAFLAYAIGSSNMWLYYRQLTPLSILLLASLAPALVFGLIVLVFRRLALRGQLFRGVLSLPLLWTAFQFLQEFRSIHSTFGNLAYSQMDFLPPLQIASVTGIWGIDFLLLLFPAALTVLFLPGASARKRMAAVFVGGILLGAMLFGEYRLHQSVESPHVAVGLIATDMKRTLFPRAGAALGLVKDYVAQIPALVARGAQVVVIPEKIGRISGADLNEADAILARTAREQRITISASFEHEPNLNETRLYSPVSGLEGTYEKHHMLPVFESHLVPGTKRMTLERPSGKWGTEICKDMDFPLLSRQYGNDGAGLMLVPAWDFVTDGWLHGRMAILRGIESGFSIARAPKQGILTVTDDRGRVLAERDTGAGHFADVVASVPVWNERTLYDRAGDWFAWFDVVCAAIVLVSIPYRRRNRPER